MKTFSINTQSFTIGIPSISNVHSFTSYTANTNSFNNSYSSLYNVKLENIRENNNSSHYTINLDWFQFICTPNDSLHALDSYKGKEIHIEKYTNHNNPNFRFNYKVNYHGYEVCEFYTHPLNDKHKKNEVSCKLNNEILYVKNWSYLIDLILQELNFKIERISRIAIALDGFQNLKIIDLCRRYLRTHTIQISNDNIDIHPFKFNKKELSWSGYLIGSKKYQKFVRIYDKVEEIKKSGKTYISDFWKNNNMPTDEVGRFELELGYRHLKKYKFNSLSDFLDIGFLSNILYVEVNIWLKFYQVKLIDIKTHRKSIAINKGKEKQYIDWTTLPVSSAPLEYIEIFPNEILNAKKSITFALRQIEKTLSTDVTHLATNYIYNVTSQYNLQKFTTSKINFIYKNQLPFENSHPLQILKERLNE